MGKKKGGRKGRGGGGDDEFDDTPAPAGTEPMPEAGGKRGKKGKGKGRKGGGGGGGGGGDEDGAPPAKTLTKKQRQAQARAARLAKAQAAAAGSGSDDDGDGDGDGDDGEANAPAPAPAPEQKRPLTKKQKAALRRQREAEAAAIKEAEEEAAAAAKEAGDEGGDSDDGGSGGGDDSDGGAPAHAFAALGISSGESDEESEESAPAPAAGGFGGLMSDSEEEDSEEEEEQKPKPKPKQEKAVDTSKMSKSQLKKYQREQKKKKAAAAAAEKTQGDDDVDALLQQLEGGGEEEAAGDNKKPAKKLTKKQLKKQKYEQEKAARIAREQAEAAAAAAAETAAAEAEAEAAAAAKAEKKAAEEKEAAAAKAAEEEAAEAAAAAAATADGNAEEERDRERYTALKKEIKQLKKERDACGSNKVGREQKKQLKKQISALESEREDIKTKWENAAAASGSSSSPVAAAVAAADSPSAAGGKRRKDGKLSNKERRRLEKETADERAKAAQDEAMKKELEFSGANVANFSCSQPAMAEDQSEAWENSKDILIEGFTITAKNKVLFNNATLKINNGQRYGFLGPNGQGKTTLLKMIAAGELRIPRAVDFLMVDQEIVADETPAVEAVLKADKPRTAALAREAELLAALDAAEDDAAVADLNGELETVYDELNSMGAERAEARARQILAGLGFDHKAQNRATKKFSGGWRMRISLAQALFIRPTLLMLDEPTNHLDLNAVLWLDDYMSTWKNTLLVVSHDQDFLTSVCQQIIHLEDQQLYYYKGSFDTFKAMHDTKVKQQLKDYDKQQKMLRAAKKSGASSKQALAKAEKGRKAAGKGRGGGGGKGADDGGGGMTESNDRDTVLIARPQEYLVRFMFNEVEDLRPPVIEVSNMSFHYPDADDGTQFPDLFNGVNFGIDMDSRICIVGPNGAGKSTLLNLVMGLLEPTGGEINRNRRMRMGRYSQHFMEHLPMLSSPVDYLRNKFGDKTYQEVRNLLGNVGLEGHAHTIKNKDLSGGQKARVVFAELMLAQPHIIFFDEPTNHLDIESVDALCEAIRAFNGGVVLVTHDARLITEVNCELWVVDQNASPQVAPFQGEFEEYKEEILAEIHANEERALVEAELRAKAREDKKKALEDARKAGKGASKVVGGADGSAQLADEDDAAVVVRDGSGGGGGDAAAAPAPAEVAEKEKEAVSLLFGKKKDKKKKKKKPKAMKL